MGSAVWCHMTMGKTAFMHQQLCSPSHVAQQKWANRVLARLYCLPEEKSQKVKCSPNPRKARKIGERGEKSTVGTLSKKWLFGLFCREERKANRRNGKQKISLQRQKELFGREKKQRMLSSACLRDSTASFSAEQEQLRGEKCLVVLVGQKEGHMIRYGQKEKERREKNGKNIP